MKMNQLKNDSAVTVPEIAVVIPTYKATQHLSEVIEGIPSYIHHVIVVDDRCPEKSGKIAQKMAETDTRIHVIFHEKNKGVGGAMVTGYRAALALNCGIVVKMDSDSQMDPSYLPELLEPLINKKAAYAKGNRFVDFKALRAMPTLRLMGNSILSFMVKACSGYWNIMDPTNGYTAISVEALEKMNLDKLANDFFFESDMLIRLNIQNAVIKDVAIPARYGNETSNLSIRRVLFKFPFLLTKGLIKRFVLKYLIFDFNMASVYTLVGFPMVIWGLVFGIIKWIENANIHVSTPTGTVMMSVLPLILGTQFILAAINIDIQSTPKSE